jgi:predicted PurR-regulated permease PerM
MSNDPKALIRYAIFMTAATAAVLWAAYVVRDVLLIVYISGLMAIGFSPTVRLIERQKLLPIGTKRFPRWLAILALYLIFIGIVAGIGALVVPPIAEQARQLWKEAPAMIDRGIAFLVSKGILDHEITWREAVQQAPVSGSKDAVGTVFSAIAGVVGGLFGFFTILILTFYILIDAERLQMSMLRLVPQRHRRRAASVSRDITIKVSAWLVGQLVLGGIIGISSAIGLWLLGIPFFFVLALVSGIGEMIPVVGPILSAIPAIAVAATVSPEKILFVLIFFILQQQFENHVLVPKVMERQVGVSAVTVIVTLLIGGKLLGILGAVLAVPTLGILQVLVSELASPGEEQ